MEFALLFLDLLETSETFLLSNFSLMNGTTYPVPVPPLYFGSRLFVWLHRFTTREKSCLQMNRNLSLPTLDIGI